MFMGLDSVKEQLQEVQVLSEDIWGTAFIVFTENELVFMGVSYTPSTWNLEMHSGK